MNHIQQAFDKMSLPICAIDNDQHIVFWNRSAAKTFGHTLQDVVGKPCWLVFQGNTPKGQPICGRHCPLVRIVAQNKPVKGFKMTTKGAHDTLHQLHIHTLPYLFDDQQTVDLLHLLQPNLANPPIYALYLFGSVRIHDKAGNLLKQLNETDVIQQAIFIYLVLNRDHVVMTTELRHQFWPLLSAEDVYQQITAVSQSLSYVLNLTNPVVQVNGGYQLHDQISFWLDINEFDKFLNQAAEETNPAYKQQLLQQAVALYQDDFLIDLPLTQSWIIAWRLHFQQGYLAALQKLSTLHEEAGDFSSAQRVYLDAIKAKPVSGEYGRSYIYLVRENSTPAQTLRQCKRLISLLQHELEILLEECCRPPEKSAASSENTQEDGRG